MYVSVLWLVIIFPYPLKCAVCSAGVFQSLSAPHTGVHSGRGRKDSPFIEEKGNGRKGKRSLQNKMQTAVRGREAGMQSEATMRHLHLHPDKRNAMSVPEPPSPHRGGKGVGKSIGFPSVCLST